MNSNIIQLKPEFNTIQSESTSYKMNTNRYTDTDYLYKCYMKITLPAIYSSYERQFQWIKYIGYNIIKEIKCTLSFNNISKSINIYTYTEWLFIWYELNLTQSEKESHYIKIGHIPKLYDPKTIYNGNYPSSNLSKQKYQWINDDKNPTMAHAVAINEDHNYNKPPSIPETDLYIPLNFWFCNDLEDILPLHILTDITFKVIFKDVHKLYTVLLSVEDFNIITSSNISSVTNINYLTDVEINENITFVHNDKPIFSKDIHKTTVSIQNYNKNEQSIFSVLTTPYRITGMPTGNLAINNFMIDTITSPPEKLNIKTTLSKGQFYEKCDPYLLLTIVSGKPFNEKQITCKGLLTDITPHNFNISTDNNGEITDSSYTINNLANNNNNNGVIGFFRHTKKTEIDTLNFTNLDYQLDIPWSNNTLQTHTNELNLAPGSIWENKHINSIKIQCDIFGSFSIKKIVQKSNILEYQNIIKFDSANITTTNTIPFNATNYKNYTESVLQKCQITMSTNNQSKNLTEHAETYNYYNLCINGPSHRLPPGVFYLGSFDKINAIQFKNATFRTININNDSSYLFYIFFDSKMIINIEAKKT